MIGKMIGLVNDDRDEACTHGHAPGELKGVESYHICFNDSTKVDTSVNEGTFTAT